MATGPSSLPVTSSNNHAKNPKKSKSKKSKEKTLQKRASGGGPLSWIRFRFRFLTPRQMVWFGLCALLCVFVTSFVLLLRKFASEPAYSPLHSMPVGENYAGKGSFMENVVEDFKPVVDGDHMSSKGLPGVLKAMGHEVKASLKAFTNANDAVQNAMVEYWTNELDEKGRKYFAEQARTKVRNDPLLGANTHVWKGGALALPGASKSAPKATMDDLAPEVLVDEFMEQLWVEPRHMYAMVKMVVDNQEHRFIDGTAAEDHAEDASGSEAAREAKKSIRSLKKSIRSVLLGQFFRALTRRLADQRGDFRVQLEEAERETMTKAKADV
mmetsp:Transcript_8264/g.21309  ORF Transcript_8264/g.21309 Transcript_8264/m.21309 type:complete len:326 (+) Transcript_8264:56-1033(+)